MMFSKKKWKSLGDRRHHTALAVGACFHHSCFELVDIINYDDVHVHILHVGLNLLCACVRACVFVCVTV